MQVDLYNGRADFISSTELLYGSKTVVVHQPTQCLT